MYQQYLQLLLEAIHAPYKEGKQYWFTLHLLLLCAMYGIYSKYRATDSLSTLLVIFLVFKLISNHISINCRCECVLFTKHKCVYSLSMQILYVTISIICVPYFICHHYFGVRHCMNKHFW